MKSGDQDYGPIRLAIGVIASLGIFAAGVLVFALILVLISRTGYGEWIFWITVSSIVGWMAFQGVTDALTQCARNHAALRSWAKLPDDQLEGHPWRWAWWRLNSNHGATGDRRDLGWSVLLRTIFALVIAAAVLTCLLTCP
jgi:hypothetical protein